MSRQGDVAAAIASTLGVAPQIASRIAEDAEIETIRARGEISGEATVVARGAVKMVSGDLVIDVARAPLLVVEVPWKHIALRSCLVARLPEGALGDHARDRALARAHAASASSLAARIEARAAATVEARLERLLSDLARRHGTRVSGGTFVALPLRGRDVASLVGTTTESVSRAFAAWKREGRIRATRDGIWLRA